MPARRIFFPIMMMYLDPDEADVYYSHFALRMTEFMDAIRERKALGTCVEISRDVMSGAYYKALVKCRTLFDFEQERLVYGGENGPKSAAPGRKNPQNRKTGGWGGGGGADPRAERPRRGGGAGSGGWLGPAAGGGPGGGVAG